MKITEKPNVENFDLIHETRKKLYNMFTQKKSELYLKGLTEDSDEFTSLVNKLNYGLTELKNIDVTYIQDKLNKLLNNMR